MIRGIRNSIGLILAVVGAAAAVWAPFRNWYNGRLGHDFRVWELFTGAGVTDSGAGLFASMFLPLLVAAVLTLVGVVLQSRLLVLIAGIIALGFAVLWMVRQGQAQGSLTVAEDGNGLGSGIGLALAGGVLMLIASAVMGGREHRPAHRARHEREQDAVRDEDRDHSGVEPEPPYGTAARRPESPYGTAARSEHEPNAADHENAGEPRRTAAGAGSADRATGDAAPPQFAPQPQQPSAPRGQPVPTRDAGSDGAGRGDRDRTQYEQGQGDEAGGSHSSDGHRSGRWHLHRGDRS